MKGYKSQSYIQEENNYSSQEEINQLVALVKDGDTQAFGKVYDLLVDRVYRFISFRVGIKEEVEDLTEEIFLKVYEKLASFDASRHIPFEAWLFRIVRNHIIDYYRTRKKEIIIDEQDVAYEGISIEETVEKQLLLENVMEALKKLPLSYREIVTLKFIEDRDNKEIAFILKKRCDQVRVLQSRALKALKKILK
ncbi:MAG: sigma-70 family RNA polymerase sigma factor [Candidatus Daviesbacteria bacterium]|nr:sigma-70 family RNA polymerase sigma factor [Candidatus Daviesbacteria bacterium]